MYLFTLAAFPLLCTGFYFSFDKTERKAYIPPVAFGIVLSAVYCFVISFFFTTDFIYTEKLLENFRYLLLSENLIPPVVLYIIFLIFSKDTVQYKIECIIPLFASFYMVFLPYKIFMTKEALDFYPLFIKPLSYICCITLIAALIQKVKNFFMKRKIFLAILFILLTIICIPVPSFIESVWYLNYNTVLWTVIFGIYAAASVYFLCNFKSEIKKAVQLQPENEGNNLC